jgi:hypothetical protein
MAISFKDVFEEINQLIADSAIDIDGEIIELDFFLGGDYKVHPNTKIKEKCQGLLKMLFRKITFI